MSDSPKQTSRQLFANARKAFTPAQFLAWAKWHRAENAALRAAERYARKMRESGWPK